MAKWSDILKSVLDCKVPSYTFLVPEDDWQFLNNQDYEYDYQDLSKGHSFQVSAVCNPDFRNAFGYNCEKQGRGSWCKFARDLVQNGVVNEHGILETGLQCPQCGCGAGGAVNLNDLYADKGTSPYFG